MCQSACLFVGRHFGRFFSLCFSSLSFCQYAVFCRFWPPLSGVAVVLWPLSYLFSAGFRLFSAPVGRRDWGRGGGGGSGSAFRRPFRRVGLVRGWWRAVVVCAARRSRAALVPRASGWRVCREAEPSGTRSRGVRVACCGRVCREAEPSGTRSARVRVACVPRGGAERHTFPGRPRGVLWSRVPRGGAERHPPSARASHEHHTSITRAATSN